MQNLRSGGAKKKGKGKKKGGASALSQNRRYGTTISHRYRAAPTRSSQQFSSDSLCRDMTAKPSFSGRVLPVGVFLGLGSSLMALLEFAY